MELFGVHVLLDIFVMTISAPLVYAWSISRSEFIIVNT